MKRRVFAASLMVLSVASGSSVIRAEDKSGLTVAVVKEIESNPAIGGNKEMLKASKVEESNGYIVVRADCVAYGKSKTSNLSEVFKHASLCKDWLKSAAETAKHVKGVKEATWKDESN